MWAVWVFFSRHKNPKEDMQEATWIMVLTRLTMKRRKKWKQGEKIKEEATTWEWRKKRNKQAAWTVCRNRSRCSKCMPMSHRAGGLRCDGVGSDKDLLTAPKPTTLWIKSCLISFMFENARIKWSKRRGRRSNINVLSLRKYSFLPLTIPALSCILVNTWGLGVEMFFFFSFLVQRGL